MLTRRSFVGAIGATFMAAEAEARAWGANGYMTRRQRHQRGGGYYAPHKFDPGKDRSPLAERPQRRIWIIDWILGR